MGNVSAHNYIVFFDDSDTTNLAIAIILVVLDAGLVRVLLLRSSMILLSLDYMASKHLRIFNLNLWIVKNIIVVIYIFDYFYWLLLIFLLWL